MEVGILTNDKVKLWLYLTTQTNISRPKLLQLYFHFKSAEAILYASESELLNLGFLSEDEIESIINKDFSGLDDNISMLKYNGVRILTIECSEYPDFLRHIKSPPLVLYCRGKFIDLNKYLCIASIGTRTPTAYGKTMTKKIVKDLCKAGFVIVSGLAQGIDSVSHIAAMETGSPTVAFVANGVDIIYPKLNAELHKSIIKSGMIVSEYPPGTLPKNYYFLERNRLVSGVSVGIFISEATLKSGSSSTVSYGIEQGKDIFALPGNVNSDLSAEPNRLIKQGAYPVTDAEDIINHYNIVYNLNMDFAQGLKSESIKDNIKITDTEEEKAKIKKISVPENLSDEEKVIFSIKNSFCDIDSISYITNISLKDLNIILLTMEMQGTIKNNNGNYEFIE